MEFRDKELNKKIKEVSDSELISCAEEVVRYLEKGKDKALVFVLRELIIRLDNSQCVIN